DARVGLAHPDLAGVHDVVEELVERDQGAPELGELGGVVGEEPGPQPTPPQRTAVLDHLVAHPAAAELREHLDGVERRSAVAGGQGPDLGTCPVEGDLAPLQPVPRVVGVVVVGAEQREQHRLRVDPPCGGDVERGAERRVDEHPAEVEDHRLRAHPPSPPPVVVPSGSSPVSSRCSKPSAGTTGTPSSAALATFDAPGESPTTSAKVFFETLPGDLPPRALMASWAPSRL